MSLGQAGAPAWPSATSRSGGHGVSGRGSNDGGLAIDLSDLNQIDVIAPDRHLVRIGPGARGGTVAERLAGEGLAISSGDPGNVGVAGLATSGGIGWLACSYGLTLERVRAAEAITVGGQWLRLTDDGSSKDGDLFWALRGAGAGLGVFIARASAPSRPARPLRGARNPAPAPGQPGRRRDLPPGVVALVRRARPHRRPAADLERRPGRVRRRRSLDQRVARVDLHVIDEGPGMTDEHLLRRRRPRHTDVGNATDTRSAIQQRPTPAQQPGDELAAARWCL